LVEGGHPFWQRYPERYRDPKGFSKFRTWGYISDDHERYIDPDFFELLGSCERHPRYKNKRGIDPQVQIFLDQEKIQIEPGWSLPVPNQEAAYISLSKYAKAETKFTPDMVEDMNRAFHWMESHFGPYMSNSRVVTLEESVARLDLNSGSGCPFNEEFPKKRDLFANDPLIMDWLEEDWTRLADDPKWTCIFSSSLKEELRPLEKIAQNSIRTFAAGAADATVHGNRLFVDQNEKMYASYLKTASCIGMSPLKGNWNKLYHKLNVFKNGYALDESQYDSSLRSYLLWGCALFRFRMLRKEDQTPENLQRIKTYYRNLINCVILTPEGNLIMKKLGMPSGGVNTVSDNTLILFVLLSYAWIRNAPKGMRSFAAFEAHTAKCLLGDDNTWSVSDEAHEFYNAVSVINVWKTIGITTTTDDLKPRFADELDFLSAKTIFMDGVAVPLYSRDKLMQSLLWAPMEHLTPETTLLRVSALLQCGWTDLPFRKFCRDLISWLLSEYDDVLKDDSRWIAAKCAILQDTRLHELYTGSKQLLPQSYVSRSVERSEMLDKEPIMSSTGRKAPKIKKNRTRKNRRTGGPKRKGTATVKKTTVRVARKRTRTRRSRGGQLSGKGKVNFNSSRMMNRRGCTIMEDEFVVAIVGSVGFATTSFPLNPGQVSLFPWLSQEAKLWERYTFEEFEAYYKRDVSEFATNGTTGKVMLSVDFDASDNPPATKTQVEDTFPHADGMPCENFSLRVPVSQLHPKGEPKYVRPAGLPGAADIKLYDAGNLFVSTQGNQNTSEVGELRVRYRVRFEVPILENLVGFPQNNSVAVFSQVAVAGAATTVPQVTPLATVQQNGLGVVNAAGQFTLPAGNYMIDADLVALDSTANLDVTTLSLQKNGVVVGITVQQDVLGGGAHFLNMSTHISQFVQALATDVFTLVNTETYTGALTISATLRIVAI